MSREPGNGGPEPGRGGVREPGEDEALDRIRRRDELLQVLFWLEGEGFEAEMTVGGVRRFLRWGAGKIGLGLRELVEDGFAVELPTRDEGPGAAGPPAEEPPHDTAGAGQAAGTGSAATPPAAVRLTDAGRREGGRRFVAEFASILSRDTHHGGECHDPECECHELGPAACTNAPSGRA